MSVCINEPFVAGYEFTVWGTACVFRHLIETKQTIGHDTSLRWHQEKGTGNIAYFCLANVSYNMSVSPSTAFRLPIIGLSVRPQLPAYQYYVYQSVHSLPILCIYYQSVHSFPLVGTIWIITLNITKQFWSNLSQP